MTTKNFKIFLDSKCKKWQQGEMMLPFYVLFLNKLPHLHTFLTNNLHHVHGMTHICFFEYQSPQT